MTPVSTLSQTRCQLGEGPFYCERRNTLFWFDILNRKRYAYDFNSGEESVLALTEMTSAMAVVDAQNDVLFTSSGLWLHNIASGGFSPVASIEADNEITRSNDARVHPSGAFWLGTMGCNAEEKAGSIYHFRKGVLTTLFSDITIPNAICFSPDGKNAYFTDTPTEKLMRVRVDPENGLPQGTPEVLIDHAGQEGGLDGAVVDADGNIWIALWGAAGVNCYDAEGALLKSIALPSQQTTCSAFVDGGKMAVTSAWQGMDDEAKKADPNAGKTFLTDAFAKPKFDPHVQI